MDAPKAIDAVWAARAELSPQDPKPFLDSMRFGLDGKNVPSQFRAKITEYVEGYELYDHVLQAGRNPRRMAELGLTQYGLDRFALAGNPKDWIERIANSPNWGPHVCGSARKAAISIARSNT